MSELLLRQHLGLGDAIVCNGLVRTLAEKESVCVLARHRNVPSVSAMFSDLGNVSVFGVESDEDADRAAEHAEGFGFHVLRLGLFGQKPFDIERWDIEMYRQANVPFEHCHSRFRIPRNWSTELSIPDRKYIFIHEDVERGFVIDRKKIKNIGYKPIVVDRSKTDNILNWRGIIENADQIHVIDSSFAILIDHLPELKAKRIAIHDYARQGKPPSYRREWERIR